MRKNTKTSASRIGDISSVPRALNLGIIPIAALNPYYTSSSSPGCVEIAAFFLRLSNCKPEVNDFVKDFSQGPLLKADVDSYQRVAY
jgi:hypothetical protein